MSFEAIRNSDINKYIGQPKVLIIDLRDKAEYDFGHIPSAINIPYEEIENYLNYLKNSSVLIFYCDRGNLSLLVARDLNKYGYQIKSLYGGIKAYRGKLERSR